MILKSDGAALYNTTDLATLMQRRDEIDPDQVIYVVDKRQGLYFEQVFRCARKTKIVKDETELFFLGFGTVNGKDGHAFKTREGGVMRLESLVSQINDQMFAKITENHEVEENEARQTAETVALAAIKYGDLSNQASKDYIFDIDRFTSFEGDTGPYLLYTVVRIKSILNRFAQEGGDLSSLSCATYRNTSEKNLMMQLTLFNSMMEGAYEEIAPHRVCAYLYDLANAFNSFYHGNKIMSEEDKKKQSEWIALITLVLKLLETCIDLLGFEAPERM
jgi:arginyl-tRNA synthetase